MGVFLFAYTSEVTETTLNKIQKSSRSRYRNEAVFSNGQMMERVMPPFILRVSL